MDQLHSVSAVLEDDERVTREFRCESRERALELMRLKFPSARSITYLDAQPIARAETTSPSRAGDDERLMQLDTEERKRTIQRNRGLLILLAGIVATVVLLQAGWVAWLGLLATGFGFYEYSAGSWGVKRARRLKSWETDLPDT